MSLIYKITNRVNNKCYIGKTDLTFEIRWKQHQADWHKKNAENRALYRAFTKYGILSFDKEVIEDNLTPEEAAIREQYWIKFYNSYDNGYNETLGGEGRSTITPEEVEQIIQLYNQKETIRDIAKILNRDSSTISNKLKSLGFEVCNQRTTKKLIAKINKEIDEVIEIYQSLSDAARALGDFSYNKHISEAARGKRKSAYGYKWRYIEEDE